MHPVLHEIISLLRLLASAEEQLHYERTVPQVPIPTELVSMWFDDLYQPDCKPIQSLSLRHQEVLAQFNAIFDADSKDFLAATSVGELLSTPAWRRVAAAADRALALLTAEGG